MSIDEQGHDYNPNCGCPGCQFVWAALECLRVNGPPPKIGTFVPVKGDFAEDPRYPGFFRTWTGEYWHPRFLLNEPVCICKGPHSQRFGCQVDDSDLPVFAGERNGKR